MAATLSIRCKHGCVCHYNAEGHPQPSCYACTVHPCSQTDGPVEPSAPPVDDIDEDQQQMTSRVMPGVQIPAGVAAAIAAAAIARANDSAATAANAINGAHDTFAVAAAVAARAALSESALGSVPPTEVTASSSNASVANMSDSSFRSAPGSVPPTVVTASSSNESIAYMADNSEATDEADVDVDQFLENIVYEAETVDTHAAANATRQHSYVPQAPSIDCSICMEDYNGSLRRPKVLPCGHSICIVCLQNLIDRNMKKCSICRTTFNASSVNDIPMNNELEKIIQILAIHQFNISPSSNHNHVNGEDSDHDSEDSESRDNFSGLRTFRNPGTDRELRNTSFSIADLSTTRRSENSHSYGDLSGLGPFGMSLPNRNIRNISFSVDDLTSANFDGRGTVKKNFNPFSTISKSGADGFLVGEALPSVEDNEKVYIDETSHGSQWRPNPNMFTCTISSPTKESKLKGMKSFVAYTVTSSMSNNSVSRRYKHFLWLHERLTDKYPLIPIPSIPEKQISGNFEEEFIEYRMKMLQSWINRICRHPILAQCEAFNHFITCRTYQTKWKVGKRKVEQDKLIGANFYATIERPEDPLNVLATEERIAEYNGFFGQLDKALKHLQETCTHQGKDRQLAYQQNYIRISHAFSKLAKAFDMDNENGSREVSLAIRHVSDAYSDIGTAFVEHDHYWDPLCHLSYEYQGLAQGVQKVIDISKDVVAKRKEVEKEGNKGQLNHQEVTSVIRRSDTISYALHAEVSHFNKERQQDFKNIMASFLTEQINLYQKITDRLIGTLQNFNNL